MRPLTGNYLNKLALSAGSLALVLAGASLVQAEPTLELYILGNEVFQGDPESSSLDTRGYISVGPEQKTLHQGLKRPVLAWSQHQGSYYLGTAGKGLLRLDRKGKAEVVAPEDDLLVSAVASDGTNLFYATSPKGTISRWQKGGAKSIYKAKTQYIWDMAAEKDALYTVTGAPAYFLKVSKKGKAKILFSPEEKHLKTLFKHPQRGWILGGGSKGIVYQVSADGTGAQALYDSGQREVTAFALDEKTGDLYAAFISEKSAGELSPDKWIGPVGKEKSSDDARSPIKASEVVRIRANGHVDKVWSAKAEGALGLAFDQKQQRLYIVTGSSKKRKSRIYAVEKQQRDRVWLMARLDAPLASHLALGPDGSLMVISSPDGAVLKVGPNYRKDSNYLSVEQDLQRVSRYGRIWFDAEMPSGTEVAISIRTGNTRIPDNTWSDWSNTIKKPTGGSIKVSPGRFAQFRAQLKANGDKVPVLRSMHASVVRENLPPVVHEVFPLRRGIYMSSMPKEFPGEKTSRLSESTLKDLRSPFGPLPGKPRVRLGERQGMMTISWNASDPNRDPLLFDVAVRKDQGPWKTVATDLEAPFWTFDSRSYADGYYQFQVIASDRPGNAPEETLTDKNHSLKVLIDNQAPQISGLKAQQAGQSIEIEVVAKDAASSLVSAQVSVDGGPWLWLPAEDGLIDAQKETLKVKLSAQDAPGLLRKLPEKQSQVSVQVVDRAGNKSTATTVVR